VKRDGERYLTVLRVAPGEEEVHPLGKRLRAGKVYFLKKGDEKK